MSRNIVTNKNGENVEDDDPILRDGQRMTIKVVDAAPKDVTDAQAGYTARLTRRTEQKAQAAYAERIARNITDNTHGHQDAHAAYVARLTRGTH